MSRNKYGNARQSYNGASFDSKRELTRYRELELMVLAGEISHLKRQVRFPLTCDGKPLRYHSGRQAVYVADFTYIERQKPTLIVEDSKGGVKTDVYKLKKAIMAANGFEILET